MSWCPRCRCEYVEGFAVCSDCGATLVDHLPPRPEPLDWDTLEPQFLMTVHSISEARSLESILKAASIPVRLKQRDTADFGIAVDVSVPSLSAAAAMELLLERGVLKPDHGDGSEHSMGEADRFPFEIKRPMLLPPEKNVLKVVATVLMVPVLLAVLLFAHAAANAVFQRLLDALYALLYRYN